MPDHFKVKGSMPDASILSQQKLSNQNTSEVHNDVFLLGTKHPLFWLAVVNKAQPTTKPRSIQSSCLRRDKKIRHFNPGFAEAQKKAAGRSLGLVFLKQIILVTFWGHYGKA